MYVNKFNHYLEFPFNYNQTQIDSFISCKQGLLFKYTRIKTLH